MQRVSSSLISTEVLFSPQCTPAKWKMAGACVDVLEGLWDFDPLGGHAGAKEKPPKGKRGRCAWYGTMDALIYPQIAHEPFESPQNLQRCEETTLDLSTTSNSLVRVNHPCGYQGTLHLEYGVSLPQLHTQYVKKLTLHGGRSSLTGSPAFTVIKNDSIDRFVWCLLIYLRFIPGNSWLYPSRTVTLTSPPAARQTGFGYSCS